MILYMLVTPKRNAKEKSREIHKASPRDMAIGNQVLLRQKKDNKLLTTYESTLYKVVEKSGNCVVIQHPTGGCNLKRKIALVKAYVNTGYDHEPCETPDLD